MKLWQLSEAPGIGQENSEGGAMGVWIFQGNPDEFDIDGYLAFRPAALIWTVNRYAEKIAIGDRVSLA